MELAYPAQLAWKRARVLAQLTGHSPLATLVAVEACVPSPRTMGYRNQAKYVFGRARDTGRLVLGAFAPRSHDLVDLAGCQVVEPVLDEARQALLEVLIDNVVEPFDEILRTGVLRYGVLRATASGQVMATLVSARHEWADAESVARALCRSCPAVTSVILNVNASAGNALFGEHERVLVGQASIEDTIADVRVRLSSRSFFQANRQVASGIYRDLVAASPDGIARAVDVYAGACGIALSLSRKIPWPREPPRIFWPSRARPPSESAWSPATPPAASPRSAMPALSCSILRARGAVRKSSPLSLACAHRCSPT
jgi:23S rRNA (uracil1939-C5)-methyltransferase